MCAYTITVQQYRDPTISHPCHRSRERLTSAAGGTHSTRCRPSRLPQGAHGQRAPSTQRVHLRMCNAKIRSIKSRSRLIEHCNALFPHTVQLTTAELANGLAHDRHFSPAPAAGATAAAAEAAAAAAGAAAREAGEAGAVAGPAAGLEQQLAVPEAAPTARRDVMHTCSVKHAHQTFAPVLSFFTQSLARAAPDTCAPATKVRATQEPRVTTATHNCLASRFNARYDRRHHLFRVPVSCSRQPVQVGDEAHVVGSDEEAEIHEHTRSAAHQNSTHFEPTGQSHISAWCSRHDTFVVLHRQLRCAPGSRRYARTAKRRRPHGQTHTTAER